MRKSSWTPSIVPKDNDRDVYLVVDDFGRNGRAWREADVEATDLETVILDLLEGQYKNPVRIVAFNTTEKWSQDVSAEVAQRLLGEWVDFARARMERNFDQIEALVKCRTPQDFVALQSELMRDNMPGGSVSNSTLALVAVSGANETAVFQFSESAL